MTPEEQAEHNLTHPILITGLPRSGTSLVTSIFEACGMWVGSYHTSPSNPKGFFENTYIRDGFVKTLLWYYGYSMFGTPPLPQIESFENEFSGAKNPIKQLLINDGYTGDKIWGYKDAKMLLMTLLWTEMFPEARWIVVERDFQDTLKSIKNSFMDKGEGARTVFEWEQYMEDMINRISYLEMDIGIDIERVFVDKIFNWDLSEIKQVVQSCGLAWNETAVAQRIDPTLWKRWERNT